MAPDRMGVRKRIALILDTNFLILMVDGVITPTHILEALEYPYEALVPDTVVSELSRLSEGAPKASTRRKARKALALLEKLSYQVIEAPEVGDVDDSIILLAINLVKESRPVVIATTDRGLRRRARQHGIPTLYYRRTESRLEADWIPP